LKNQRTIPRCGEVPAKKSSIMETSVSASGWFCFKLAMLSLACSSVSSSR